MCCPQLPCTNCNRNLAPKRAVLRTKLAARGNFGPSKGHFPHKSSCIGNIFAVMTANKHPRS